MMMIFDIYSTQQDLVAISTEKMITIVIEAVFCTYTSQLIRGHDRDDRFIHRSTFKFSDIIAGIGEDWLSNSLNIGSDLGLSRQLWNTLVSDTHSEHPLILRHIS